MRVCDECGRAVFWEQLAGARVFVEVAGVRRYRTRCGCGDVARDERGRKLSAPNGREKKGRGR